MAYYNGKRTLGKVVYNKATPDDNRLIERKITGYTNGNVTEVGSYVFSNWQTLEGIALTGAITIGDSAFYNCKGLKNANVRSAETIADDSFYGCQALESIDLPNAKSIGWRSFYQCYALKSVKLGSVETIDTQAFYTCRALEVVDFTGCESVPTLASSNAFTNVPTTCLFVIPDELYYEWTNATNWSALSFTYIMQSEYENSTATITDLTGTTWVFNDTVTSFPSVTTDYAISFTSYADNVPSNEFEAVKLMPAGNIYYIQGSYWAVVYNSSGWVNAQSKTISITGGTDATNAEIIAWLQANATMQ